MSLSFNCGQYYQAFDSKRLQNWEAPSSHRRRPSNKEGFTQFIANNKGHILPSIPRSSRSPWGTFVGTWDLPRSIPGNQQMDPTARSADAHFRQASAKQEAEVVIKGKQKFRRAKAGQPVQAMPVYNDPPAPPVDHPIRSRANNPLVRGTPSRLSPVKALSPNVTKQTPFESCENLEPAIRGHSPKPQLTPPVRVSPRLTSPPANIPPSAHRISSATAGEAAPMANNTEQQYQTADNPAAVPSRQSQVQEAPLV